MKVYNAFLLERVQPSKFIALVDLFSNIEISCHGTIKGMDLITYVRTHILLIVAHSHKLT